MKIIHNFISILGIIGLAACSVGPTAFLSDGSRVTLGGSIAAKADADARQASMPNGMKLTWVRSKPDETPVPKAAIGAWLGSKVVGGAVAVDAAHQKTAQVTAQEATKQAQISADAATAGTALKQSATTTSNVTAPGVTVTQP